MSALNQIEAAHEAVEGAGPGRRFRTQQINGAYAVLLAGQFQEFCRNLHTEAASFIANASPTPALQIAVLAGLTQDRQLDKGNAQPRSLGLDFQRFNMSFWAEVGRLDPRNSARQLKLGQLNVWRNAVAHQDFDFTQDELVKTAGTRLTLRFVRGWRRTCEALAIQFERAVSAHLATLVGVAPPW